MQFHQIWSTIIQPSETNFIPGDIVIHSISFSYCKSWLYHNFFFIPFFRESAENKNSIEVFFIDFASLYHNKFFFFKEYPKKSIKTFEKKHLITVVNLFIKCEKLKWFAIFFFTSWIDWGNEFNVKYQSKICHLNWNLINSLCMIFGSSFK